MVGTADGDDLVVQELLVGQAVREPARQRTDGDVDCPRGEERGETGAGVHAELDVEVGRASGEQLDQPGRGVLREEAGGRHPQLSAPVPGLADLPYRAVLQTQDLHGPARETKSSRGEGQARPGPGEQLVVELAPQL